MVTDLLRKPDFGRSWSFFEICEMQQRLGGCKVIPFEGCRSREKDEIVASIVILDESGDTRGEFGGRNGGEKLNKKPKYDDEISILLL